MANKPIQKTTLAVLVLSLVGFLLPVSAWAQQSHELRLTGDKSVPPVGTGAYGKLIVRFADDTLTVSGSFESLTGQYHSAGIFVGPEDERGNRLFLLTVDLNEEKTGGEFLAEKNKFHLNEPQKMWLAEGEFYISISSYEHVNGEIRAQLPAMGSGSIP